MFQDNTVQVTINLIPETCISCGTVFGVADHQLDQLKKSGATYYCPNGHGQHYNPGPTPEQKRIKELEQKLDREKAAADYWRKSAQGEEQAHQQTKNQLRGKKAALTKIKKRVGNGVCPCCNRTFQNLQRHMSCKHPEYETAGPGEP